jgi:hypothetical protein
MMHKPASVVSTAIVAMMAVESPACAATELPACERGRGSEEGREAKGRASQRWMAHRRAQPEAARSALCC